MRARFIQSSIMKSAPPFDRSDTDSARLPRYQQRQRRRMELMVAPSFLCLIYLFLGREMHIQTPLRRSALGNNSPNDSALGPASSRYPMSNVVLMGQFNFDMGPALVKSWAKIWSKYFKHIVAAGPFAVETTDELKATGILVHTGRPDKGFVSPYENLMETMLDYYNWRVNKKDLPSFRMDKIDGVLYVHDDALLNITRLFEGDETVPVNTIIRTFKANAWVKSFQQYSIYVEHQRWRWSDGTEESRVSPVVYFENTPEAPKIVRKKQTSLKELVKLLPKWPHMKDCVQQQVKMFSKYDKSWWETFSDHSTGPVLSEDVVGAPNDSRGSNLTLEVISRNSYRFSFPGFQQSDFLYMPLKYTKLFEQAARPHVESEVFLECAIPTIVHWVMQAANKMSKTVSPNELRRNDPDLDEGVMVAPKLKEVPICTDWTRNTGTDNMLMDCIRSSSDLGIFHPKKIAEMGPEGAVVYEMWLDQIQRPPTNATFALLAAAIKRAQRSTKRTQFKVKLIIQVLSTINE